MIRAALLALCFAAGMASCKPAPRTITADDLRANPVIGDLGVPLGTVVRITGVAAPEGYSRVKADLDYALILVRSIDGHNLSHEMLFRISWSLPGAPKPPEPDAPFDLLVFESGGYVGVPQPAMNYGGGFATIVGHSFVTRLTIVAPGDATPVR